MINHLSYSSISLYLDCAEAWRRKYVAKEPTVATPALVFGSAFHNTIEQLIGQFGRNDEENQAVLAQTPAVWKEKWEMATEQEVAWGMDTPEQHFNEGLRMLNHDDIKAALLSIRAGKDKLGVQIERKIELSVPGVPVPIIGYIDIITEDGTPADFKTSNRSWSEDKAKDSMQSLFYLAGMNQMGIPVNWRFKHIIFTKTKKPQVQVLDHSHHPKELFFLFDLVKRVWKGIEQEVYPMNPGTWKCSPNFCDHWSNCRGKYV